MAISTRDSGGVVVSATSDPINPPHYRDLDPQPWDVVDAWELDYFSASALAYIARAGRKDPKKYAEDLRKAIAFLEKGASLFDVRMNRTPQ